MQIFKHDWQLSDAACEWIRGLGIQPDWNVLEYGPGHSTWVIQESLRPLTHTCIDEPGEWSALFLKHAAGLAIDYEVRDLGSYFTPLDRKFDLILVDGPAAIGSRGAGYDALMSMSRPDTVIIIDDCHRDAERELALRVRNSGTWKLLVVGDIHYRTRQTAILY